MKRLLTLLSIILLAISVMSAAPLCTDASVLGQDVTSAALSGGCTLGGLTFSNFTVTPTASVSGAQIYLSAGGTGVVGSSVNLGFQLSGANPSSGGGDIIFSYMVTGVTMGVDMVLGVANGVTIGEEACADDPSDGCQSILAFLQVNKPNGPTSNSATYSPTGQVWITKDISISNGGFISDFKNSHEVPEPMTYLLLGSGLFGIGLLRRRMSRG